MISKQNKLWRIYIFIPLNNENSLNNLLKQYLIIFRDNNCQISIIQHVPSDDFEECQCLEIMKAI